MMPWRYYSTKILGPKTIVQWCLFWPWSQGVPEHHRLERSDGSTHAIWSIHIKNLEQIQTIQFTNKSTWHKLLYITYFHAIWLHILTSCARIQKNHSSEPPVGHPTGIQEKVVCWLGLNQHFHKKLLMGDNFRLNGAYAIPVSLVQTVGEPKKKHQAS